MASGEINSTVDDQIARVDAVRARYGSQDGVTTDEMDGLTVQLPDGAWFNLRASNTEPLLRLNVEAPDEARMTQVRDEVLEMVRSATMTGERASQGAPATEERNESGMEPQS